MKKDSVITDNWFRERINKRSLYIWGCGHLGTTLYDSFSARDIPVAGFIDSLIEASVFRQKKVFRPDDLFALEKDDSFIVITASLYEAEIKEHCSSSPIG